MAIPDFHKYILQALNTWNKQIGEYGANYACHQIKLQLAQRTKFDFNIYLGCSFAVIYITILSISINLAATLYLPLAIQWSTGQTGVLPFG